jgi:hypothetical protein
MPFVTLIQTTPSTPSGTSPIEAYTTGVQDFEWTISWEPFPVFPFAQCRRRCGDTRMGEAKRSRAGLDRDR